MRTAILFILSGFLLACSSQEATPTTTSAPADEVMTPVPEPVPTVPAFKAEFPTNDWKSRLHLTAAENEVHTIGYYNSSLDGWIVVSQNMSYTRDPKGLLIRDSKRQWLVLFPGQPHPKVQELVPGKIATYSVAHFEENGIRTIAYAYVKLENVTGMVVIVGSAASGQQHQLEQAVIKAAQTVSVEDIPAP